MTEGELQRLNEEFAVEYMYNSNAIEGNTLTLRETDLVLRGLTINKKPLKDHMEAVGHKEAFDLVCELVTAKSPCHQADSFSRALGQERGPWRIQTSSCSHFGSTS